MVQVYKSKIDTWLGVVLAAAIMLCTVPFLLSLISGNSDELLPKLQCCETCCYFHLCIFNFA